MPIGSLESKLGLNNRRLEIGNRQSITWPLGDLHSTLGNHRRMTVTFAFVVLLVILALIFDYINGFHDAANSIATVVSTRVLSPGLAVIWAAFFNFIAFAIFGTRVAKSIGDGVRMDLISADLRLYVLLAALLGAIVWNLITWYLGLPTSSSHALLGGGAGGGGAAGGGGGGGRVAGVEVARIAWRVCRCGRCGVRRCERIAQS